MIWMDGCIEDDGMKILFYSGTISWVHGVIKGMKEQYYILSASRVGV